MVMEASGVNEGLLLGNVSTLCVDTRTRNNGCCCKSRSCRCLLEPMQLHETEAVTGGVIPVAFQKVGPQEVEASVCMQKATVEPQSAGVP